MKRTKFDESITNTFDDLTHEELDDVLDIQANGIVTATLAVATYDRKSNHYKVLHEHLTEHVKNLALRMLEDRK
jgi:hypothetical protein